MKMIEKLLGGLARLPADKVLHFALGVVLFALWLPFLGSLGALVAVVLAGVLKELYDAVRPGLHTPDLLDAVVTVVGAAVAYFCAVYGR